jgi:hypothetical protein
MLELFFRLLALLLKFKPQIFTGSKSITNLVGKKIDINKTGSKGTEL